MTKNIFLYPIGHVCSQRTESLDDAWDGMVQRINLNEKQFYPQALSGLWNSRF